MGPTQQQLKQQHPSYFIVWPGLRTTAQIGSLETSRALERTCLKKGLGDGDGETWINLTDNSGARMNRMYWLVTCEKWGKMWIKNYLEVLPGKGFPGGSDGKGSACNAGDVGSIPGSSIHQKIPWRREWLPTPIVLSGEPHGQRSLAGYGP